MPGPTSRDRKRDRRNGFPERQKLGVSSAVWGSVVESGSRVSSSSRGGASGGGEVAKGFTEIWRVISKEITGE